MVARLIVPEIAERYGRSADTVSKQWSTREEWPRPVGKRGRWLEYDALEVAAFVRDHVERELVSLDPQRLYTAQEIEAATGIKAATIRADRSRGRWPDPDDTEHGAQRWSGRAVSAVLATRRGYRRRGGT
ncbi:MULTISPECIES: hypothetical protein [Streptomycetaceae]|uniref:DNA-binding protein n=1 Tax=Streptantibioticus cattleyicolor (strain ATCC 35852 / DSM 46488 / JCM 4925 / NBRC 14057 / NRRL 8057) TaxID=1003195 RepID=F8JY41_STREN|nr:MULTISPECIES: hypothetical protein [Streptomycetaceae]AEW94617.1 hypothetical protein SCATT_22460 [Streptantibioticus cattleyicolor NRRL 8057 = DSM 46488]MYS59255.1 hypothetical protein [Streptomyces sp. SID5468]CCB74974.1 protein of unknown function [Streptantibioticus cattleyicolor NRRL 8057 = DSM 46488]